ncbi:E3 ubiquitin-protein ligase SPL2-like [Cornus florida]|uniref:E3 ubiquitin-protein ligase SPL2-like n=1 Tax=Cornus florida TaxID=4283 RepID=UPI002896809E|nr:E3 ubiquitin-protein ligase SPL2-like [Cornus florida]
MSPSKEFESVGNGAILTGLGLACVALPCWLRSRYYRDRVRPKLMDGVQSVAISDLRSLLDTSPTNPAAATTTTGRLIFVRGIIQAKVAKDGDHFISKSGEKAVALRRVVWKFFSKDWRDLFLPVSDLKTRIREFHEERRWHLINKVPFILVEGGQKPSSDYIVVNMDVDDHLIPLQTSYRQYEPIDRSVTDILRPSEHGFPVCQLLEEAILPLGGRISAVGICCYENGIPVISHCKELHYFLTNCGSKDELVEEVLSQSKTLSKLSLFLVLLALGFYSFGVVRKWRTSKGLR